MYGFAVASVVVCTIMRWLLNPLLENQGLYLAYMIPVAVSAYLGGAGPGVISATLSATIASPFIFQSPVPDQRASLTHLLLFGVESAAVILLIRQLHRSREEVEQSLESTEAARRVAEEANHAKEQFVARVSHEWRGPLNIMSGWLWQLEGRAVDRDFVVRAAASMRRAVAMQKRLVSDLLDYSRGSHGKLSIDVERLAIAEPVKRAIDATSVEATDKHLTVTCVGLYADARVWGDVVRLEQVFTNLLQNAIKFTPSGGTVSIAFARCDDQVAVTVTDSGIGIEANALARIFDPFTQTDERRDARQGGLGLGLAIARDIVRAHGGSLTASSPGLGAGSSFCVRLPSAAEHERLSVM